MTVNEEVFIWTHAFLTLVLNEGRGKPFASHLRRFLSMKIPPGAH